MNDHTAYIKLRVAKSLAFHKMNLPCSIGARGDCQVIIHSPTLSGTFKSLRIKDQDLELYDAGSNTHLQGESLRSFFRSCGLKIDGPFWVKNSQSAFRQKLSEILQKENRFFETLPSRLRKWLGASLPQNERLFFWLILLCLFTTLAKTIDRLADLSGSKNRKIISSNLDGLPKLTLGSDPSNQTLKDGFNLLIELPKATQTQDLLLRFENRGITDAGDLQIRYQGKPFFESSSQTECHAKYCLSTVRLPSGTKKDVLQLDFIKKYSEYPYRIKKIEITPLKEANEEDKLALKMSLDLAKRKLSERKIAHTNLIAAKKSLDKLAANLDTFRDEKALKAEVQILKDQLTVAWNEALASLEFEASRQGKLGHYTQAKTTLETMLGFYPDPRQAEYLRIRAQIEDLENKR